MRFPGLFVPLILTQPALAHEAVANHAHPHADWTLAGLGLLVVGLVAAALMPALKSRRERRRK